MKVKNYKKVGQNQKYSREPNFNAIFYHKLTHINKYLAIC